MADHPEWCDRARCDAGRVGGKHRGLVTPVGNPDHPITTVWVEKVRGELRVVMPASYAPLEWSLVDARKVAAAVDQVAVEAGRVRV